MKKIFLISFSTITITACSTTSSTAINIPTLPSCGQILPILKSAGDEFEEIKSGPKITDRNHSQAYWNSSIQLPETNECIVRENYSMGNKFRCSWIHNSDRASMGQHYQALRDRIISCVGDVEVYRNDIKGYTSINLAPFGQLRSLKYTIRAIYETPPYKVYFDVDTD